MSSSENAQFGEPPAGNGETPLTVPVAADSSVPPAVALSPAPARRDPVWSGWDVALIAGLTVLTIPVLVVSLGVAAHLLWPRTNINSIAPMLLVAAQFVAYIVVAIFMIMLVEGKYHVRFWQAIHWNWPRAGLGMLGLGVLLLLCVDVAARFLPMPKNTPFDQFFSHPRDAYFISVFAVTLGPLMEELFFRGLLYPVLARRWGVFWGVLVTALPFGLMHMFQYGYAWGVVLLIFLMGVVCTVVRARTGSVAASFLVHVGYNGTEMFLLLLATDGFRHMEKAGLALF